MAGGITLLEGVKPSLHGHAGRLVVGCIFHHGSMDLVESISALTLSAFTAHLLQVHHLRFPLA